MRRSCWYSLLAGLVLTTSVSVARTSQNVDRELRAALKQAVGKAESFDNRFHAQVWLMDMANRLKSLIPDAGKRMRMLRIVHREARRANLKPELVLAVIQVESAFQQYAISSAGARGLMQVMPFWKDEIGRPGDNMFNMQTNLRYGCTILRYYLDMADGNLSEALARYNGSYGQHWYPRRIYEALSSHWYIR